MRWRWRWMMIWWIERFPFSYSSTRLYVTQLSPRAMTFRLLISIFLLIIISSCSGLAPASLAQYRWWLITLVPFSFRYIASAHYQLANTLRFDTFGLLYYLTYSHALISGWRTPKLSPLLPPAFLALSLLFAPRPPPPHLPLHMPHFAHKFSASTAAPASAHHRHALPAAICFYFSRLFLALIVFGQLLFLTDMADDVFDEIIYSMAYSHFTAIVSSLLSSLTEVLPSPHGLEMPLHGPQRATDDDLAASRVLFDISGKMMMIDDDDMNRRFLLDFDFWLLFHFHIGLSLSRPHRPYFASLSACASTIKVSRLSLHFIH